MSGTTLETMSVFAAIADVCYFNCKSWWSVEIQADRYSSRADNATCHAQVQLMSSTVCSSDAIRQAFIGEWGLSPMSQHQTSHKGSCLSTNDVANPAMIIPSFHKGIDGSIIQELVVLNHDASKPTRCRCLVRYPRRCDTLELQIISALFWSHVT
jgi:hypothetical protein